MSDYDLQQKILHSPFSITVHKRTFTNYLEVVITSDGTIMYAVPSHQEMLIYLACKKCKLKEAGLYKGNIPQIHKNKN